MLGVGRDSRNLGRPSLGRRAAGGVGAGVVLATGEVDHRADVQPRSRGAGGRGRGRLRGGATELRCDLACEVAHTGVHPVAGAALVGEPSVDGQDHLVRLGGVVEGLVLVAQPEQLLLAVALADVHAERDELLVHDILEGIRRGGVGRALDGHGSLVVGVGGRTPRTIALIHAQQHPAIHADTVVAGRLTGRRREHVAQRLHRTLAYHAMRGDTVDGVGALAGMIRAEFRIVYERTVAHAITSIRGRCVLVVVGLTVPCPLDFDCLTLIGRALKVQQHTVAGSPNGSRGFQGGQHGLVAGGKLLKQKIELHIQVPDGLASSPSESKQILFSAPIRPLSEAVARAVVDKVLVLPAVYSGGVRRVCVAQLLLVGVL